MNPRAVPLRHAREPQGHKVLEVIPSLYPLSLPPPSFAIALVRSDLPYFLTSMIARAF